jgi:hypothetical protein
MTVPAMHSCSLEHSDFESVLLRCNCLLVHNPQYAADFEVVATVWQERKVAVQTMKSIARGTCGDES